MSTEPIKAHEHFRHDHTIDNVTAEMTDIELDGLADTICTEALDAGWELDHADVYGVLTDRRDDLADSDTPTVAVAAAWAEIQAQGEN